MPDEASIAVTASDYRRSLRTLFAQGTGRTFPRKRREQGIFLHALWREVAPREPTGERAVSERIFCWLMTVGQNFAVDAVTLRRALCDDGFLERDPAGSAYRSSRRFERLFSFDAEVAAIDVTGVVEEDRAAVRSAALLHRVDVPGRSPDARPAPDR
ncbi:MAG: DUF2087 domain-containing protein [Acidobacteriota bacterium]